MGMNFVNKLLCIDWKIIMIKTKANNRYKVPFLALTCALSKKHTF